ncbi:MAG: 4Fe-4S dicluster domain-containing protein [Deltaproteobacteria bacterium]
MGFEDQLPATHEPSDAGAIPAGREPAAAPETAEMLPSRRDFLKMAGFAFAGVTLSGCERAPVQQALAPVVQPEGTVPGRVYEYATTCGGCSAGCGVLARVRDGRPIKLEGNPQHPLSHGGLCAAGQASLLGLYDQQRLRRPLRTGQPADWHSVDGAIRTRLEEIRKEGGAVRFLTGCVTSPTTSALIQRLLEGLPEARHVVLAPRSGAAIPAAHARTHGVPVMPRYHFDKAQTVVSFDADFLGRWISPVEFAAAYQSGRRLDDPEARPSYHVQFESRLSLTGAKADRRMLVGPGEMGLVMSHLGARLAGRVGIDLERTDLDKPPVAEAFLTDLVDRLWQHRERSLIVCDSQVVDQQVLCNFLNHVLGNYGSTLDLEQPSLQQGGSDSELESLVREIGAGQVAALFVYQCNPVHDLPGGEALAEALRRVPLFVSLAERLDETASLAGYVCPVPHTLEAWSDAEPVSGLVSVLQPAFAPLDGPRPALESLAAWTGKPQSAYELLLAAWEQNVFPRWQGKGTFQEFWDTTVHDGFARVSPRAVAVRPFAMETVRLIPHATIPAEGTFSLVLYTKVGMPDASHAYNPWLQELPDPITKVAWDNYAGLSPAAAIRLGVADGDVVRLEAGGGGDEPVTLELPALVQRGQHDQVVTVSLGYGSRLSERFARVGPHWYQAGATLGPDGRVGKNAADLLTWLDGSLHCAREGVRLTKTGRRQPLAMTQSYDLLAVPAHLALPGQERRPVIRETTLAAIDKERDAKAGPAAEVRHEDLWPEDHPVTGPKWGMAIDLNACNGCSACVVACQAENNIPVVGRDEVLRHREMYWIRIDRYYTDGDGGVDVAHQPMLCQHCGNAPCEAVCPVLATVHSEDGLNQQVYNRCVGTRYCANNCPYKVRRFNWFDYAHDDVLQNLVLNPDVTVRSRGVMEKCTFCVQRIEAARVEAGGRAVPVADGAVQTACQQSCPAQAIVFGDLNDPASRVSRLTAGPRSYRVLEELNVRPAVSYLAVVRNRGEAEGEQAHG